MSTLQVRKLKAFGAQIQIETVRDLDLLRAIETTLDSLDIRCESLRQISRAADDFIKLLKECDITFSNGDVDLVSLFEGARDSTEAAYKKWETKYLCALNAPELKDDDCVVDAYALLLTEVAALHDKLNTLCWLIGEQQADQDKTLLGAFSSADDLFAAMGV